MTRSRSCSTHWEAAIIGVALLAAAAGCAGFPASGRLATQPTAAQLRFARDSQPDWVYYPAYGIYFSTNQRRYAFWDGSAWVSRREPAPSVTHEMLEATPAVGMRFHDFPAQHHAEMVRIYPRNWLPATTVMVSTRGN